jgi:ribosome production factor 1
MPRGVGDGQRSGGGHALLASNIKNKQKRSEVVNKLRLAKAAAKTEARKKRKREEDKTGIVQPRKVNSFPRNGKHETAQFARQKLTPRPLTLSMPYYLQVPRTIDSARELDETMVAPDDEEVLGDEADDEMAGVWDGSETPKVMVTTQKGPSGKIFPVIAELLNVIPNAFYYKRGHFELKKICEYAGEKDFTHLVVLTERFKKPNGMIVVKLPDGPTAAFKMRSTVLTKDIEGHGRSTTHIPEIILNNFGTRLGRRVGRLLGSLFSHEPELTGRQVATFHNQRDFIFFRYHRYIFEEKTEDDMKREAKRAASSGAGAGAGAGAGEGAGAGAGPGIAAKVRMQELGPRFTLRLKYLLSGPFDPKFGDYEWFRHRHDQEASRRKFQL